MTVLMMEITPPFTMPIDSSSISMKRPITSALTMNCPKKTYNGFNPNLIVTIINPAVQAKTMNIMK